MKLPQLGEAIAKQNEMYELYVRLQALTPEERMMVVEMVLSDIRRKHFTDHEAIERDLDAMIADPDFQRVMNNEDLPILESERTREAG